MAVSRIADVSVSATLGATIAQDSIGAGASTCRDDSLLR